ncbi:hypothetical protein HYPSUDRAFT_128954 [Hypholoma sublateritium FD-334 SS-4]|uniref:Plant basic secretory protein n=1 Tax=Hypholoma sublateritium (strain FD-334 SS-4) TaxID=945553 RepID=A0A0D2QAA6_HYPSF|nr:hypothetical protein HYPSUDRAFT_128954 [Hypholoma sublateritium FD-334 SS-4]
MPPLPPTPPPRKAPTFRLRVDDLAHPGVAVFFSAVVPADVLQRAVDASMTWLYTRETAPTKYVVKSITLILRAMDGVAHTTGTRTHKEIHLSLDYVLKTRYHAADEITGVLVHEAVHCFQHFARGTCPGGLVEGIADFVRLRAGRAPPHWTRSADGAWDAGYERTAYFLAWLDARGAPTAPEEGTFVRRLNASMRSGAYDARIFETLAGQPVDALWTAYGASFAAPNKAAPDDVPAEAPPPA